MKMVLGLIFPLILSVGLVAQPADSVNTIDGKQDSVIIKNLQEILERCSQEMADGHCNGNKDTEGMSSQMETTISYTLGCITALGLMSTFLEKPRNFMSFWTFVLELGLGTCIGGAVLNVVYHPIVRLLRMLFRQISDGSDRSGLYCKVLAGFVQRWPELRWQAPVPLHAQFDELYLNYLKNGAKIELTEDDAKKLFDDVVMSCIDDSTKHFDGQKI